MKIKVLNQIVYTLVLCLLAAIFMPAAMAGETSYTPVGSSEHLENAEATVTFYTNDSFTYIYYLSVEDAVEYGWRDAQYMKGVFGPSATLKEHITISVLTKAECEPLVFREPIAYTLSSYSGEFSVIGTDSMLIVKEDASLAFSGGTRLTGSGTGVSVEKGASFTLQNASIETTGKGIVSHGGTISIEGGSITAADTAIEVEGGSITVVEKPTIRTAADQITYQITGNAATTICGGVYPGGITSNVPLKNLTADGYAIFQTADDSRLPANELNSNSTEKDVTIHKIPESHTCGGITFEELYDIAQLNTPGNYYLSQDMKLSLSGNSWTIPEGASCNLCLNGHTLNVEKAFVYQEQNRNLIVVAGQLGIYDCSGNGKLEQTGYRSFDDSVIAIDGGTFTLNGGSISGGTNGVTLNSGRFTMHHGTIDCGYNYTQYIYGSGVVVNGGTFQMNGGTVKCSTDYGMNITGGDVTLSGNVEIEKLTATKAISLGTLGADANITALTSTVADLLLVPASKGGTEEKAGAFTGSGSTSVFWDEEKNGIRMHTHTLKYNLTRANPAFCAPNGFDRIVETCESCDHRETITLVAPGNVMYDGNTHAPVLEVSKGYLGDSTPNFIHYGVGSAPVSPKQYTVTYYMYDTVNPTLSVQYCIFKEPDFYPLMPQAEAVTATTIQVTDCYKAGGSGTLQYALSATGTEPTHGWQTSRLFTGLTPNTTYYAFAKYTGDTGGGSSTAYAPAVTGPSAPIVTKGVSAVSFETNGGAIHTGSLSRYNEGEVTPLPTDVTRTGYTFAGWYENSTFTGDQVTEIGAGESGDKTFYARWLSSDTGITAVSLNGVAGTIDHNTGTVSVILPSGTTLPTDSGVVKITPAAGATVSGLKTDDHGATWTFTVTAQDGTTTREYTMRVSVALVGPQITTAFLPIAMQGEGYSYRLNVTGSAPITWQIKAGSLPDGMTLDSATGILSGTPDKALSYTFTVVARNAAGTDEKELNLVVEGPAHAIEVETDGHGTASADAATAKEGVAITLKATPHSGYHFKEWQVLSGGVTITNNTFTMPGKAVKIQAIFEKDTPASVPAITSPVKSQTVTVEEGGCAVLTIAAQNAHTYQWYIQRNDGKGFVAIHGATSPSYTTSAVNLDNDGFRYHCVVTSAHGKTATSPVFTLEVTQTPQLPQTGDSGALGLWCVLLLLSFVGMVALSLKRKLNEMASVNTPSR